MRKKNLVFRAVSFILIFCVLFIVVTEVLKDKRIEGEYNPTTKIRGFYAEKKDSLDFVFVGSSQVYAHIAPGVLWRDYGITSYDFTANEQPLWISYYYIKEVLKYQKPKAILLDVFTVYGADYEAEGVNHINLDDLPFSINKINAIKDSVPKELQYSYFFELAKYHTTWEGLTKEKVEASFRYDKDPMKGYSPFVFAREYQDSAQEAVINQTECEEIPAKAQEWLKKIITLTKEEGVELVLFKTPNGNADRQKLYNSVSVIAKEENVPFINMNTVLDGEAHVNVLQAERITKYIGDYLVTNYEVSDKRGKSGYEEWDESALLFDRYKKKCQIISADTPEEYFSCLKDDENLLVMLTMKVNEEGYPKEIVDAVNEMGLTCSVDENVEEGYLAVIDGGKILAEKQGADNLSEKISCGEHKLSVKVSNKGDCVMKLDGLDYSLNVDGINIVVYDKVLQETYEMAGFSYKDEYKIERK